MKLVILAALAALAVVSVHARPRFIAIPLENVQVVEVDEFGARPQPPRSPLVRIARRAGAAHYDQQEQDADEDTVRLQRQAGGGGGGGHDHVDYGAHTGHHGAFGWYADFPVHTGN